MVWSSGYKNCPIIKESNSIVSVNGRKEDGGKKGRTIFMVARDLEVPVDELSSTGLLSPKLTRSWSTKIQTETFVLEMVGEREQGGGTNKKVGGKTKLPSAATYQLAKIYQVNKKV
ncbi:hypothetical protein J6590_048315 [Homalodisca vitripennis]|nr:hypothetical protein J6590_048315 [Homalodisca vitripennis]